MDRRRSIEQQLPAERRRNEIWLLLGMTAVSGVAGLAVGVVEPDDGRALIVTVLAEECGAAWRGDDDVVEHLRLCIETLGEDARAFGGQVPSDRVAEDHRATTARRYEPEYAAAFAVRRGGQVRSSA